MKEINCRGDKCARTPKYEVGPDPIRSAKSTARKWLACGTHLSGVVEYMTVPGRSVLVTRLPKNEGAT